MPTLYNGQAGVMTLEIVSHCWHYAPQLTYQLSSLVLWPPSRAVVKMTVFYASDDTPTETVLRYFAKIDPPRVEWSWRCLPKEKLFRRSIGRNVAALETTADWIWFADADMCFRCGCLDALGQITETLSADLIFPQTIQISDTHSAGDLALDNVAGQPLIADINPAEFVPHHYRRAIGGVQIVRGNTARRVGYCRDLPKYQKPISRWVSPHDDVAFRRTLGTPGEPIDLPELYRIRHARYGPRDEFGHLQNQTESGKPM